MARHATRTFSHVAAFLLFAVALLTACAGMDGGDTRPAAPTTSGLPAPDERVQPGQAEFYAQLKEYGIVLTKGADPYVQARRAMNACPEYSEGQTPAQRIGLLAERFGLSAEKASLVYSATILHLCADPR